MFKSRFFSFEFPREWIRTKKPNVQNVQTTVFFLFGLGLLKAQMAWTVNQSQIIPFCEATFIERPAATEQKHHAFPARTEISQSFTNANLSTHLLFKTQRS